MLECQLGNLLKYPDRCLMTLIFDSGGVPSRRILSRLIAAEQM